MVSNFECSCIASLSLVVVFDFYGPIDWRKLDVQISYHIVLFVGCSLDEYHVVFMFFSIELWSYLDLPIRINISFYDYAVALQLRQKLNTNAFLILTTNGMMFAMLKEDGIQIG